MWSDAALAHLSECPRLADLTFGYHQPVEEPDHFTAVAVQQAVVRCGDRDGDAGDGIGQREEHWPIHGESWKGYKDMTEGERSGTAEPGRISVTEICCNPRLGDCRNKSDLWKATLKSGLAADHYVPDLGQAEEV